MDLQQAAVPAGRDARNAAWGRWILRLLWMATMLFALSAIDYAAALAAGRTPWIHHLLALAVSHDFVHGERATTHYVRSHYLEALGSIGGHMVLGGIALGLGTLQFVPALRRRHRTLHRASGAVVALAAVLSMAGAFGFLVYVPMREGASGPAFHLGLWALTGLTLFLLLQAALAARARDFRSHMVWMALVFATLATAPMLRVDWALFGRFTSLNQETANLASGMLVLVQTALLMALWLHYVGDHDLPARPAQPASAWSQRLLLAFSALAALGLVHEALAIAGLDLFAAARAPADRPPAPSLLWCCASLFALVLLPRTWAAALRGERPAILPACTIALAAIGAIAGGLAADGSSLARIAIQTYWVGIGITLLLTLLLALRARPGSSGRNMWLLFTLALLWLPAQVPGLLALGLMLRIGFDEAMAAALVNATGALLVIGVATGYAAPLRLTARRPARAP